MADGSGLQVLAERICPGEPLDLGIVRAVDVLQRSGIHTFESCDAIHDGAAYPEPTVRFHGSIGEGWKALAVCLDYRMPVMALRREWDITNGEVDGPVWALTFRHAHPDAFDVESG